MNECIKNMMERRSCRSYNDKMVSKEILDEILLAGEWAPSGMGMQSPLFVAVQDEQTVKLLSKLNAQIMGSSSDPFYGAKTVIVVLADGNRPTYVEDGSLAMGNLMNAANALGVSSCWIHRAKEVFQTEEGKKLMEKWGIPKNYIGVGNCILGYPKDTITAGKPRKDNYVIYIE